MSSKASINGLPLRIVLALAAALLIMGGCVPSEEDFKEDHPFGASNLTCEVSLSGNGTFASPGILGTAPKCFEFQNSLDTYYLVTIPTAGTWTFQIDNMSGDMDLFVFEGTTFITLIDSSINGGTTIDSLSLSVSAGTGGILVDNPFGGNNFYRVAVFQ